jgi:hypothetical protein
MTDLTDRATEAGWTLPEGWTVQAEAIPDEYLGHPRDEYGTDGYDEEQCAAFDRGDWSWCYVHVAVRDAQGRDWGSNGIGGVEWGELPGAGWIDPLEDTPRSYSVIREHDMIAEALRDALKSLEAFGDPHGLIREPAVNYSGI